MGLSPRAALTEGPLALQDVQAFLASSGGLGWWGRRHLVRERGGSSITDKALQSLAPPPG